MIEINSERLLADLRDLASFGKVSTGVSRTAFTPQDIEARKWLRERMRQAGLDARIDRFGTVYGRAPGAGRTVLVGSHSDTVPDGGWLDGALGVIYGLEIARTMAEAGHPGIVDVISFQDEEGTFIPCLGSKAFCGVLPDDELARAVSADGRSLAEILPVAGLPKDTVTLERGRHTAFLEAHIEQGPRLEAAGIGIGVVTGIAGIRRYLIGTTGRADHAGTTPMAMRRDAGAELVRFAAALLQQLPDWADAESVWNIGKIEFIPGAANVVPAEASLILEVRDLDEAVLDRVETAVRSLVDESGIARDCPMTIKSLGGVVATGMDPALQAVLMGTVDDLSCPVLQMPSGAGHDTMIMARAVPSAMIFVPSIGGRSHHVDENTTDADIVHGCRFLANAVDRLRRENWLEKE